MSVPADNTRLKHRSCGGKTPAQPAEAKVSVVKSFSPNKSDTEDYLRTKRCQKKQFIADEDRREKNKRVKQWLSASAKNLNLTPRLSQTTTCITSKATTLQLKEIKSDRSVAVRLGQDIKGAFAVTKTSVATKLGMSTRTTRQSARTLRLSEKLRHTMSSTENSQDDYLSVCSDPWQSSSAKEKVTHGWSASGSSADGSQHDHGSCQVNNYHHDQESLDGETSVSVGSSEEKVEEKDGSRQQSPQTSVNSVTEQEDPEETVIQNPIAESVELLERYKRRLQEEDKTVFYDMFELLITKMAQVQETIAAVQKDQSVMQEEVRRIKVDLSQFKVDNQEITTDLDDVCAMNTKLIESTIKCEETINVIDKTLQKIEASNRKGEFLVYGVVRDEQLSFKLMVLGFLKSVMDLPRPVRVISAHPIGKRLSAPIWFKLEDPDDVALIFKNISNLKEQVNRFGKPYHVREFLTEKGKEEDARQRDLLMDNRKLPMSHQASITRARGNVIINQEPYQKAIVPPKLKEVLLASQTHNLQKLQIQSGSSHQEKGSAFYVYAAKVTSFEDIKEKYGAIKAEHLSASHIMCGYRLFGAKISNLQDYSDDGEHGGGRYILNMLKELSVWNLAVFVVRYHDGPNLGQRRYQIISSLTKEIVSSYHGPLEYGQGLHDKQLLRIYKKLEADKKAAQEKRMRTTELKEVETMDQLDPIEGTNGANG